MDAFKEWIAARTPGLYKHLHAIGRGGHFVSRLRENLRLLNITSRSAVDECLDRTEVQWLSCLNDDAMYAWALAEIDGAAQDSAKLAVAASICQGYEDEEDEVEIIDAVPWT